MVGGVGVAPPVIHRTRHIQTVRQTDTEQLPVIMMIIIFSFFSFSFFWRGATVRAPRRGHRLNHVTFYDGAQSGGGWVTFRFAKIHCANFI